MRRRIENPRILLLDCPLGKYGTCSTCMQCVLIRRTACTAQPLLNPDASSLFSFSSCFSSLPSNPPPPPRPFRSSEYKKGESQTNVEIMNEEDFNSLLRQEEEYIETICAHVSTHSLLNEQTYIRFKPSSFAFFLSIYPSIYLSFFFNFFLSFFLLDFLPAKPVPPLLFNTLP
jgi:hypothetical protein